MKNKKSSVVYGYSVSKKSDSDVPQIQERFNPRPYFDYGKPPKKSSNGGDSKPKGGDSNPTVVYGSPFASFPVFTKAQVTNPDESDNLYDSPYSSYNPPEKMKEDKDPTMYNFPPLAPPATTDDFAAPPADDDDDDDGDDGGKPPAPPSNAYLPPPAPPAPADDDDSNGMDEPPKGAKYPGPYAQLPSYPDDSDSYMAKPPSTAYGPPSHHGDSDSYMAKPPSTAYGPPGHDDDDSDSYVAKPPSTAYGPNGHDQDAPDDMGDMPKMPSTGHGPLPPDHDMHYGHHDAPPITQTVEPHHGYYDHGPPDYDPKHNFHYDHPVGPPAPPPPMPMPDDDMHMPPADGADGAHGPPGYGHLPQYLDHDPKDHGYDFYGYDHHPVYHEVTTTEAPEDMRVNKGQYSYYYLGRKLWYIPLYFSIYFIIYVTVLILKSIARHKVDFKQNLHDLHKGYRKSRNMDLDDVHRKVAEAVETTTRKYEFM